MKMKVSDLVYLFYLFMYLLLVSPITFVWLALPHVGHGDIIVIS